MISKYKQGDRIKLFDGRTGTVTDAVKYLDSGWVLIILDDTKETASYPEQNMDYAENSINFIKD
jgi:hypothetical protein